MSNKLDEVVEELKERGAKLQEKLEALVRAGNVRRVVIRGSEGKAIVTFSVTIGVVGFLCAPLLVTVAAIVAACSDCKVEVVKTKK